MEDPDYEVVDKLEELTETAIEDLEAFLAAFPPARDVPLYRVSRSRSSPIQWRLIPADMRPESLRLSFETQQDASIDYYVDLAQTTSNPVFMWIALSFALEATAGQQAADASLSGSIVLPGRIGSYLQDCAARLLSLCSEAQPKSQNASNLQKMLQEIPRIFGFSSQGTNAFKQYQFVKELLEDFSIHSTAVLLGASSKEGYALVQEKRGLANERQAQRRVAEGRDLSGGKKRVPGRSVARRKTTAT